ncbi:acyl transferase domain-containing protein [Whalleya microplaca]|nr:acyl transferase domain-containing protein [Whalleya microplaca]
MAIDLIRLDVIAVWLRHLPIASPYTIVLNPVCQAIADGDVIRAVIRSTASNQDGKTPSLTRPSADSQEDLIRNVYKKAGLSFESTRYFEAHGTGTPIVDPIEMEAIGRVLKPFRSSQEPLYAGSVKSNLGHLEGCSGLAGIIKSVLILEKGVIPGNALFKKINPSINADSYNLAVAAENTIWPTHGQRRVSVSSYGFGGSNAHVVMDDAYHYLQELDLVANHCTASSPSTEGQDSDPSNRASFHRDSRNDEPSATSTRRTVSNGQCLHSAAGIDEASSGTAAIYVDGERYNSWADSFVQTKSLPRLLVWSASDEKALSRMADALDALAFTLSARRSHLLWRTFAIASHQVDSQANGLLAAKSVRTSADLGLAFVFTGQGAQYINMGLELLQYAVFKDTLWKAERVYNDLGSEWSILDEIRNAETIDEPEYSQPICTALQIALVELLKSFNVVPNVVLGHSSGEIAAAYSTGALSFESACKVSYFRGKLVQKLKATTTSPGAMLAVNLAEHEVYDYLKRAVLSVLETNIEVACINSPVNCTVSGTEEAIDTFKEQLDKGGIFAQKLKTGVAYHSSAMQEIVTEYMSQLESLEPGNPISPSAVLMFSSVIGRNITPQLLCSPSYWVDNLVSPVRFLDAVRACVRGISRSMGGKRTAFDFLEVGPHSALRRPLLDTLSNAGQGIRETRYASVLHRSKSPIQSVLVLVGQLFCHGYPLTVPVANQQMSNLGPIPFLANCPEYPFDHSQRYWSESRLSRDFRLREPVHGDLLGSRSNDWNPLEPRWRAVLNMDSSPWMRDHVVSDTILLPGTCMLLMSLEAAKQMCPPHRQITGYFIKDAQFLSAIILNGSADAATETMVYLRPVQNIYEKEMVWSDVRVQYDEPIQQVDGGMEKRLADARILHEYESATHSCRTAVDRREFYNYCADNGLKYGEWFQLLESIHWNGDEVAIARVHAPGLKHLTSSLVHPAVLDATIQILQVQRSKGLSNPSPTNVPYQLFNAWVSASGWQQDQGSSIRCLTRGRCKPGGQSIESTIYTLADDGTLLCSFQNLVLKATSKDEKGDKAAKRLLYGIAWKPQVSLLDSEQLHIACKAEVFDRDETSMERYRTLLDHTLSVIIQTTLEQMSDDCQMVPDRLKRYIAWMNHYSERDSMVQRSNESSSNELELLLQELEGQCPSWKIFPVIARNLKSILYGKIDPLRLAFDAELAETFYADVFDIMCDHKFQTLLELITHENPTLRILEVDAGTGGWTRRILSILQGLEKRKGASTFSEYEYTDISPSFFEKAKTKFSDFENRISFKTFDLERSVTEQGFRPGSYDIIIAGSVLHATADLTSTIRHIRILLKPGGRLINLEPIAPEKLAINFAFGTFPGWWLCNEERRSFSPTIDETSWDHYKSEICHLFSIMVSTAEETRPDVSLKVQPRALLVISEQSKRQIELARAIQGNLLQSSGHKSRLITLDQILGADLAEDDIVVSLIELGSPFLLTMQDEGFQSLKYLINRTQNLLWVTSTNLNDPNFSSYSLMHGFLRSMRSEAFEKHIVTLAIKSQWETVQPSCEYVIKVLRASFEFNCPELEYIVRDGLITTGRLLEETSLNDTLNSLVSPQTRKEPLGLGPPLKLIVDTPGMLDTFRFVEDSMYGVELGPEEVEIETKAWGLSFRDVFVALGRLEGTDLGYDCSGVVRRVGSACKRGFHPGDRVCMNSLGCMRTYCRAHEMGISHIPNELSFEKAASIIGPGITAYHFLVNVARLQAGEKVLIHSASGSTGQMAVWIAKMIGAEIFVTVGLDDKKGFLVKEFGIESDHIFYSRNTSFAQGIMRVTNASGVDVVLNSLAGDGLRASWECIAPYGRFIEIGKADITANSSLPMASFARNVTFSAVDMHYVAQTNIGLIRELLDATMDLVSRGAIHHPSPLHTYSASEVEAAFRYLQSGRSTGRIIISINPCDVVQKRIIYRFDWEFDDNASYLIAGGLGGLGRAIIRWMLEAQGVYVATPKCDVSSATALSAVLDECHAMPPVKGCINAAMVLEDAVFDNMSVEQWNQTVRSKVQTSWNLHQLLPLDMDFFIFLSSLAGVYGSVAQSNYAAGCSYQDSLARYRLSQGKKAISFDIGWVRTIGVIAETERYQQNRKNAADMGQIEDIELMSLLDIYCNPSQPILPAERSQLLVGVVTPGDLLAESQPLSPLVQRPLFAGFTQPPKGTKSLVAGKDTIDYAMSFEHTSGTEERSEVVVKALAAKLARSLAISPGDVEPSKPLSDYGVDSLMAVELRNWIGKDFRINLAVFDIMGGATIAEIGELVANRAKERN